MSEHRTLLYLAWATLAVLLALLVLAILHRRRLNQVSDQLAEGAVDNGETLKGVVKFENDATRKHVSGAVDAIRSDTKFAKLRIMDLADKQAVDANEHRGQMTALRERLRAVVEVTDTLLKRLAEIPAQVGEWLTRKPPP